MKITVVGGTGRTGSAIVAEAGRRGHDVTAVSRSGRTVEGATQNLSVDITDTAEIMRLISESDVTFFAVSTGRTAESIQPTFEGYKAIIEARPSKRVIFVGGAGSLLNDDGVRMIDQPNFPPDFKPVSGAYVKILDILLELGDEIPWTYVSPAPGYPSRLETGKYVLGTDHPAGRRLSPADFALALVDEAENGKFLHRRFTAASVEE